MQPGRGRRAGKADRVAESEQTDRSQTTRPTITTASNRGKGTLKPTTHDRQRTADIVASSEIGSSPLKVTLNANCISTDDKCRRHVEYHDHVHTTTAHTTPNVQQADRQIVTNILCAESDNDATAGITR